MSLAARCADIARVAAKPESGIAVAYNAPPETLSVYPMSWVKPVAGDVTRGSDDALWLHWIELIVYVEPRIDDLPVEFATIAPLVTSIEATFWAAYLNTEFSEEDDQIKVSNCLVKSYQIGIRDFAGKPQHAITFTLRVQETTL